MQLVQYDVALRYSDSGAFHDSFLGAGRFPLLSIPGWLLDDLGVPSGTVRDEAERSLFLVAALLAMRTHTLEGIADPASNYDETYVALADFCYARTGRELARLVPPAATFWRLFDTLTVDELDWLADGGGRSLQSDALPDPSTLLRGRWSVPARTLARAALEFAGHAPGREGAAQTERLDVVLDALARAHQIRSDLESMHADLQRGHMTYPIAYVATDAGIRFQPAPSPEQLLGALALSGAMAALHGQAVELLHEARLGAEALDLPTLAGYLRAAEQVFGRTAQTASGSRLGGAVEGSPVDGPLVRISPQPLAKALDMAERYLLSDRQFRDSWETHREGLFGSGEVAARFPAGLVLDTLRRQGHDLRPETDAFLEHCVSNRFRYYDHPWCDADSDTVGVYLRLRGPRDLGPRHERAVAGVLACLEREVAERGEVPVWIPGYADVPTNRPAILALGAGCGTVAAHLLLGLWSGPQAVRSHTAILTAGTGSLLRRLGESGLGANVAYPPAYALAVYFRLVRKLGKGQLDDPMHEVANRASQRLDAALDALVARAQPTAQSAALSSIACREAGRADLIAPGWSTTILKAQRPDGSWPPEPFAAAPHRSGWVGWYSSSILTSTLCYEALLGRPDA